MLQRLAAVIREKVNEMDQTIALKADRRDSEAEAILRTNRGKALMDEANVFLSGIVRAADRRLTEGVEEQRANAAMLRLAVDRGRRRDRAGGGRRDALPRTATPAKSARRATKCVRSMPAWKSAWRGARPTSRRRAIAPRCYWRRSTIASPTA